MAVVQVRKYQCNKAQEHVVDCGVGFAGLAAPPLPRALKRHDQTARSSVHAQVFFGFTLLGTDIITLEHDIPQPLLGISFWHGPFYLWFSLTLNIAGIALIAKLLYMIAGDGWHCQS